MDRRWRGQQGKEALSTLQSFHTYRAQLPVLTAGLGVADPADIYATAVYTPLANARKSSAALSKLWRIL